MPETTFRSIQLPNMSAPARVPETAAEFSSERAYELREYCTYQGKLYICTTKHSAGAWNSNHFTETNIGNQISLKLNTPTSGTTAPSKPKDGDLWFDESEDGVIYGIDPNPTYGSSNAVSSGGVKIALDNLSTQKLNAINIAGDFSESARYYVGNYTLFEKQLYKCIVAHAPGPWDENHFRATSVGTEIGQKDSVISAAVTAYLQEHPEAIVGVEDGSITTPKLADRSVTSIKIDDGAITSLKINDLAVTTNKINNGAVNEDKLSPSSVTSGKIGDGQVTNSKLAGDAVRIRITGQTIGINDFKEEGSYASQGYPYRAKISVANVDSNMKPDVCFDLSSILLSILAPIVETYDGGFYVYASEIPNSSITITVADFVR